MSLTDITAAVLILPAKKATKTPFFFYKILKYKKILCITQYYTLSAITIL